MNIFVISLKRAAERRKKIVSQLNEKSCAYTVIDAVDSAACEPEYLLSHVDQAAVIRNIGRPLAGPEIGCALSHRMAYKMIIDSGSHGALILEDDVTLTPKFEMALSYFSQVGHQIEIRPEVYHFGALSRPYARNLVLRRRGAKSEGSGLCFREPVDRFSSEVWGTCGYYITKRAAECMLEPGKIVSVADHWSLWMKRSNGKLYVAIPPPILHPEELSLSDIEKSRYIARNQEYKSSHQMIAGFYSRVVFRLRAKLMIYVIRPLARIVYE
ncbi:glycosyltransferase family 25 protein [Aquibium sp. ELW1220]|uniref:glycosyltransferase family 25 protein n=1 Tax=Aquibium sp. ELW1220 TaxID=2976766 RepID=UPI0025AF5AD5|nr:glycosyltransferase family 25 protein [Aquibium sp. ELW1220]MDN2578970.1 glycosyltransferase family 25 protein [Aquibium sp. ELW1220]